MQTKGWLLRVIWEQREDAEGGICKQGTRLVSAVSTGQEHVRGAQSSGQSCSAAQVLQREYKPQQTLMDICSTPSALLNPSGR